MSSKESPLHAPARLNDTPGLLLQQVLRLLRPLVRLLVRQGVHFPAFSQAMKPLFVEAARQELGRNGMQTTDSALSLMSGVHRHDVRAFRRDGGPAARSLSPSLSFAGEVIARWMSDRRWAPRGRPRVLPRQGAELSFGTLVASISSDVRPSAVLDELLRLGAVTESDAGIALAEAGFAPRQNWTEMAAAFADNLHDHAAAAAANLQGDANFLEQAVYVDEIGRQSLAQLQHTAREVWQTVFKAVMAQAQARFDADQAELPASERVYRARLGIYFYEDRMDAAPADTGLLPSNQNQKDAP